MDGYEYESYQGWLGLLCWRGDSDDGDRCGENLRQKTVLVHTVLAVSRPAYLCGGSTQPRTSRFTPAILTGEVRVVGAFVHT